MLPFCLATRYEPKTSRDHPSLHSRGPSISYIPAPREGTTQKVTWVVWPCLQISRPTRGAFGGIPVRFASSPQRGGKEDRRQEALDKTDPS